MTRKEDYLSSDEFQKVGAHKQGGIGSVASSFPKHCLEEKSTMISFDANLQKLDSNLWLRHRFLGSHRANSRPSQSGGRFRRRRTRGSSDAADRVITCGLLFNSGGFPSNS